MAKVIIDWDECYRAFIVPYDEADDHFPRAYLPVEIPDNLVEAYRLLYDAEWKMRRLITDMYGEPSRNPNYDEEWKQFIIESSAPKPLERNDGGCCDSNVPAPDGWRAEGTVWKCPTCGFSWVWEIEEADGAAWWPYFTFPDQDET